MSTNSVYYEMTSFLIFFSSVGSSIILLINMLSQSCLNIYETVSMESSFHSRKKCTALFKSRFTSLTCLGLESVKTKQ
jgi:hypothetical protein